MSLQRVDEMTRVAKHTVIQRKVLHIDCEPRYSLNCSKSSHIPAVSERSQIGTSGQIQLDR